MYFLCKYYFIILCYFVIIKTTQDNKVIFTWDIISLIPDLWITACIAEVFTESNRPGVEPQVRETIDQIAFTYNERGFIFFIG